VAVNEVRAVVTGVSRGLGQALAQRLVARGDHVIGVSRSVLPAATGRFRTIAGDLADPEVVEAVRLAVGDGHLDLLVNNAAVGGAAGLTNALLPAVLQADHPVVLNIGSRMGNVDFNRSLPAEVRPASYAYRVSKAAVEMLTVALARELGLGATVLCLDPGPMATAMGRPEAERTPGAVAEEIIRRLDEFRAMATGSTVSLLEGRS
jgi:NAD(P)-dependent dehydrogenase (short-subunit alcohol dehydrogenase family)